MPDLRPVPGWSRAVLLRERPCHPVLRPGRLVAARILHDRFGNPAAELEPDGGLLEFQRDAVLRARAILAQRGGVVIADSVGLGKTHVALELMRPALAARAAVTVVGPAALQRHWRSAARDAGEFEWVSFARLSRGSFRTGARDLVVIDEAHALRNPAARRYHHAQRLVRGAAVVLVTATPVNNSIFDLYHLLRLFAGDRDFADVGVPSLRAAFEEARSGCLLGSAPSVQPVLRAVLIRRTRRELPPDFAPSDARFPVQAPPVPVYYAFSGRGEADLLGCVGAALLDLEFPVHRSAGASPTATPAELMRRSLFKRLESSVHAFGVSLNRYDALLRRCDDALGRGVLIRIDGSGRDTDQISLDELMYEPAGDIAHVEELRAAIARERARVAPVRAALDVVGDAKLAALEALLRALDGQRILLFTQYRDTARYLHTRLARRFRVALVDGGGALLGGGDADRSEVIRRFAPIANGAPTPAAPETIDVLIATDVLSEGFSLQDAAVVVSYDLPWNPIRLVQRVGRIDRLGSRHERVASYYFLPGDLDRYLGLVDRIAAKTVAIDATVGSDMPTLHAQAVRALDRRDAAYLAQLEQEADPFAVDAAMRTLLHRLPASDTPGPRLAYASLPAGNETRPCTAMVAARVGSALEWIAVVGDQGMRDDRHCAELVTQAALQERPGPPLAMEALDGVLRAARHEIARRQVVVESSPLLPACGVANRVGRRLLALAARLPGGADPALYTRIEEAMERLAHASAAQLSDAFPSGIPSATDLREMIEAIEALPRPARFGPTADRPVQLVAAIIRAPAER